MTYRLLLLLLCAVPFVATRSQQSDAVPVKHTVKPTVRRNMDSLQHVGEVVVL